MVVRRVRHKNLENDLLFSVKISSFREFTKLSFDSTKDGGALPFKFFLLFFERTVQLHPVFNNGLNKSGEKEKRPVLKIYEREK